MINYITGFFQSTPPLVWEKPNEGEELTYIYERSTNNTFLTKIEVEKLQKKSPPDHRQQILLATAFAADKHWHQVRSGTTIPYIVHPIGVAITLLKAGSPLEVVIAGLFHDTLEDAFSPDAAAITAQEISDHFGEEILALVEAVTDKDEGPKLEQKERQIDKMKHAEDRVKQVKLADCINNLEFTHTHGVPSHWKDKPDWQEYYYITHKTRMVEAALQNNPSPICKTLAKKLRETINKLAAKHFSPKLERQGTA